MNHGLSEHIDSWKTAYYKESLSIKERLEDNFIEIHHIGSTSVADLIAKPQIDIVVSVHNLQHTINQMAGSGYIFKGEFNIPFRYFFGKNQDNLKINLHIVLDNDPEMDGFIKFRDYMRTHPEAVQTYSDLKLSVSDKLDLRKRYGMFNEYTLSKDEFIRDILAKAGFEGLCMRFVVHYNERDYEKTVCKQYRRNINKREQRFVFYKGSDIIGYANVSSVGQINIFEIPDEYKKYFENRLNLYIESRLSSYRA